MHLDIQIPRYLISYPNVCSMCSHPYCLQVKVPTVKQEVVESNLVYARGNPDCTKWDRQHLNNIYFNVKTEYFKICFHCHHWVSYAPALAPLLWELVLRDETPFTIVLIQSSHFHCTKVNN